MFLASIFMPSLMDTCGDSTTSETALYLGDPLGHGALHPQNRSGFDVCPEARMHSIDLLYISLFLLPFLYRTQLVRMKSFLKLDIARAYRDASGRHRIVPWLDNSAWLQGSVGWVRASILEL